MRQLSWLFCVSWALFSSCESKNNCLIPISQEEFQKLHTTDKSIQLIDARTQKEFE